MEEIRFLIYTIIAEAPAAALLLPRAFFARTISTVIAVNFVTHPIAWWAYQAGLSWWTIEGSVLLFEAGVFAAIFPRYRWRAVTAAVAMNICSAAIGMLIL